MIALESQWRKWVEIIYRLTFTPIIGRIVIIELILGNTR